MPRVSESLSILDLIERQSKLTNSGLIFERVVGNLWVAGLLKRRLALLTDRQSGQLLFDHVWDEDRKSVV